MRHSRLLCGLGLIGCLVAQTSSAWHAEDEWPAQQREAALHLYGFDVWGGKTASPHSLAPGAWTPVFSNMNLAHVQERHAPSIETNGNGECVRRAYSLTPAGASNEMWECDTELYPSPDDAQRMMIVRFMGINMSAYRPTPGEAAGVSVGDISFVGKGYGDRSRTIYFCRNNVFARVQVKGTDIRACNAIAEELDRQILQHSVPQAEPSSATNEATPQPTN